MREGVFHPDGMIALLRGEAQLRALRLTGEMSWALLGLSGWEVLIEYENPLEVKCYPQRLNQVFINILVNDAQAIEDKG